MTTGEGSAARRLRWRSEGLPAPARVGVADDATPADAAFRRLRKGERLLYTGDYHNARQLLAAVGRRLRPPAPQPSLAEAFRAERRFRRLERDTLSGLLVPVEGDLRVALRRGPEVAAAALREVWGPPDGEPSTLPLRELLGMIGAHEWRRKGVQVAALGAAVHPHYGVFAPVRSEYVTLVAEALAARRLAGRTAFDVGTGTGVLAFLAARAGARARATDDDPRAVACARENAERLGLAGQVEVERRDLFPEGRADLVLCNPPWLPAEPLGPLDHAVYDPGGRFLAAFLERLPEHLAPGGEAFLVISDLAERLGLRPAGALLASIAAAGLRVAERREARPVHPRARDADDPLHAARAAEVTTLYVLGTG
ncbi:MAG TPA: class I SAM-dependent methyltransferase [Anaeromyxobacteraceae bacterium]|nr:class I SAM-dependent methyltransferase [Anaeromyxobacteraceae bacterium]